MRLAIRLESPQCDLRSMTLDSRHVSQSAVFGLAGDLHATSISGMGFPPRANRGGLIRSSSPFRHPGNSGRAETRSLRSGLLKRPNVCTVRARVRTCRDITNPRPDSCIMGAGCPARRIPDAYAPDLRTFSGVVAGECGSSAEIRIHVCGCWSVKNSPDREEGALA